MYGQSGAGGFVSRKHKNICTERLDLSTAATSLPLQTSACVGDSARHSATAARIRFAFFITFWASLPSTCRSRRDAAAWQSFCASRRRAALFPQYNQIIIGSLPRPAAPHSATKLSIGYAWDSGTRPLQRTPGNTTNSRFVACAILSRTMKFRLCTCSCGLFHTLSCFVPARTGLTRAKRRQCFPDHRRGNIVRAKRIDAPEIPLRSRRIWQTRRSGQAVSSIRFNTNRIALVPLILLTIDTALSAGPLRGGH
jgi:hypothetical protein